KSYVVGILPSALPVGQLPSGEASDRAAEIHRRNNAAKAHCAERQSAFVNNRIPSVSSAQTQIVERRRVEPSESVFDGAFQTKRFGRRQCSVRRRSVGVKAGFVDGIENLRRVAAEEIQL